MSLRAGRVGVNPADVDPITGHISSEASEGYTKAEADEKFLSKSDASSTYESKSEASTAHNLLQPKTLAVPISMLDGSKLTVETALQGLNSGKGAYMEVSESAATDIVSGASVASDIGNHLVKSGNIVTLDLGLTGVSAQQWVTTIAKIPEGYRPKYRVTFRDSSNNLILYCMPSGNIGSGSADYTDKSLVMHATWITA